MSTEKTKSEMKEDQKKAFLDALVKEFGEGSVVSRADLLKVWHRNPGKFVHVTFVRKNPDYKVGRNQFVVTASETPAKVRDEVMKTMTKVTAEKETKKLPKKTRGSVKELAKLVKDGLSKSENVDNSPVLAGDTETLGGDSEDINDILRVSL